MPEPMTARQKILAALLLAPSAVGLVAHIVLRIGAALGNRSLSNSDLVGGSFVASLILQPFATFITICWVIASWAKHRRVAPWLLWTAVGNCAAFYLLYLIANS